MNYTIGIGALIDGIPFNKIRETELNIAIESRNWQGLFQPPHVTVKRPFVANDEVFKITKKFMFELASQLSTFDIVLKDIEHFGTNVVYASVKNSEKLTDMHIRIINELKNYNVEIDPYESENMIFHSTLTMGTSEKEFVKASSAAESFKSDLPLTCTVNKLGLFLAVDDIKHWVVIAEADLK